jgi:CubicO group peptidase (beta-lactamase class C family)
MRDRLILCLLLGFSNLVYGQVGDYAKIVDYYTNDKKFSGAVLVARGGRISYSSYRGLAHRELSTPVSGNTRFRICSITKTFTAAIVLKLVEEGKLELDSPISAYFPEYSGKGRDSVTLHHLLTYSSGIPNCNGNRGMEVYQTPIPRDSFISKYCSAAPEHLPGTRFNYENGGYIILGKIIEKVSGRTFSQNLDELILKPLGMKNTGFISGREIVEGLAAGYLYNDSTGSFENDPPYYIENFHSSAAMYSTVEDLLKFDQAIFTYKLLKKSTVEKMLTPYPELWSVAYGFWVTDNQYGGLKLRAADRQGAIMGNNTTWLHLISDNITVIIFSNTNATPINEMREKLVLATLGQPFALPARKEDHTRTSR